jgi:hypothetical protein
MTTREAYYVLDHWREYPPEQVRWAQEIVDSYERQGGVRP